MIQKEDFLFHEEDLKIIQLLNNLGMPKHHAKTLLYLSQVDHCMAIDIEECMNLRQPEVSIMMRDFEKQGLITKNILRKESKGRPAFLYKLHMNLTDILDSVSDEKFNEIKLIEEKFDKLKSMTK